MFLEKEFNCKIINVPLKQLMPIATVFIATCSSTILWAVLSKVPSIVVNFNELDYDMYDFLETTTIVNKKEKLLPSIQKTLIQETDFTQD